MSRSSDSDAVKPWDILNPNEPRSDEQIKADRLAICENCEHFKQKMRQCRLCNCFMDIKTTLTRAKCPVDKW